ncbi:MerR family DNA-binding transcriptional regulator [Saccharothrix xinjiangensis]|uniref:MerR family DNA-binding transcriptional regulator n=1 Tax=Saccharothrix xinjiangensis TaxID=204798 RepID=A0ABV9XVL6_9PSEU
MPPRPKLVSTGVAAAELGIDRVTLARWWRAGLVEPEFVTAGGHARWDMDKLRQSLRERARREEG